MCVCIVAAPQEKGEEEGSSGPTEGQEGCRAQEGREPIVWEKSQELWNWWGTVFALVLFC